VVGNQEITGDSGGGDGEEEMAKLSGEENAKREGKVWLLGKKESA